MKASRWAMLAIAGAGAAASAYVVDSDRPSVTPASSVAPARAERPSASAHALADLERAPLSGRMSANPFASWIARPEAPPAPALEASPPPPPPAFPYKYAGTVKHANGTTEALLLRGGELVPIKAGALLDGGWRIEAVTEDRIEVTFVPGNERRSLLLASLVEEPKGAPESARTASAAPYEQLNTGPGVAEAPNASSRAAPNPGVILGGRAVATAGAAAATASAAGPVVGGASAVSSGAALGAAASGATSTPLGAPTAPRGTQLGTEAPTQGSMPLGTAPSGSFPTGVTPTGKLGL